jgi:hypothetical protein
MADIRENDTFTPYFKDVVESVGNSDEIRAAKEKVEYGLSDPIPMDEEFKGEVLTVVKAIKICEDDAKDIWIGGIIGSFLVSALCLYIAANTLVNGDSSVSNTIFSGLFGVGGIAVPILSIKGEIDNKKRAAADAIAVRAASGLDEATMKVILQQLAEEGRSAAKKYYEHYFSNDEKKGKAL